MRNIHRLLISILIFLYVCTPVFGGSITVLFLGDGPSNYSKLLIKSFKETYPDIKVIPKYLSGNYGGDMASYIFKGKFDVYVGDRWVIQECMDQALLYDLIKIIPKNKLDLVPLNLKSEFMYKQSLYALPTGGLAQTLLFNKSLFDDAGLMYPDHTWTWDNHFFKACAKMSKDKDGNGIPDVTGAAYYPYGNEYYTIIQSYGGASANVSRSGAVTRSYNTKPTIDALNLLLDMGKAKAMEFVSEGAYPVDVHPFDVQKAALRLVWNNYEQGFQADFERRGLKATLGIAPVPKGPRGAIPLINSSGVCIFSKAPNKKDSAKLVQFLLDTKQQLIKLADGILPTTLPALISKEVNENKPAWYINSYRNGRGRSLNPRIHKFETEMWLNLYNVVVGKLTYEAFISLGK